MAELRLAAFECHYVLSCESAVLNKLPVYDC